MSEKVIDIESYPVKPTDDVVTPVEYKKKDF